MQRETVSQGFRFCFETKIQRNYKYVRFDKHLIKPKDLLTMTIKVIDITNCRDLHPATPNSKSKSGRSPEEYTFSVNRWVHNLAPTQPTIISVSSYIHRMLTIGAQSTNLTLPRGLRQPENSWLNSC